MQRIISIDILRGLVMVIMALDHARDYFHHGTILGQDPMDLSSTTPWLYLTRWITHFCAPVFVFLSGTSAYLMARRTDPGKASVFLLTRGLWLVVLELTVIYFGWTFSPYWPSVMLTVIWAIGIGFIVLGLLMRLPTRFVGFLGLLIVFVHNAFDGIVIDDPAWFSVLWSMLHVSGTFEPMAGHIVFVGYPVLPWIGIMLIGYACGALWNKGVTAQDRQGTLARMGITAIGLFLLLRLINLYGDAHHWTMHVDPITTMMSFLDTTKYPPSLLFTCMTLGPSLLLLSWLESHDVRRNFLVVFGRVPLFYYVLHIYVLHAVAWVVALAMGYGWKQFDVATGFGGIPPGFGFSLPWVYVIWICVVAALYPLCRWYDGYKTANRHKVWLRYL